MPVPRAGSGAGFGSDPAGGSVVTLRRFARGGVASGAGTPDGAGEAGGSEGAGTTTYCWMIVIGSVTGLVSTPSIVITRRATASGSLNRSKACTRR